MEKLPFEIWCHIFPFLGPRGLLICWHVSRFWRLAVIQRSCWKKNGIRLKLSNLDICQAAATSSQVFIQKVLHINTKRLETISITDVEAHHRIFTAFKEQDALKPLTFPALTTVDLSGTGVNTSQILGLMNKCKQLLNLILRQCQQVDDQVLKTYAYMPVEGRTADLPPSLKTLKHVWISRNLAALFTVF